MNAVGTSQEQAIDLDDLRDGSSEVELIVSSTLDGDTNLPAATTERKSPTPQNQLSKDMVRESAAAEHESPLFVSEGSPSSSNAEVGEALRPDLIERNGLAVVIPRLENHWEYRRYEAPPAVIEILEEYDDGGLLEYLVQLDDESEEVVSRHSGLIPNSLLTTTHITCLVLHAIFTGSWIRPILSSPTQYFPPPMAVLQRYHLYRYF